jgi:hypothetical protein
VPPIPPFRGGLTGFAGKRDGVAGGGGGGSASDGEQDDQDALEEAEEMEVEQEEDQEQEEDREQEEEREQKEEREQDEMEEDEPIQREETLEQACRRIQAKLGDQIGQLMRQAGTKNAEKAQEWLQVANAVAAIQVKPSSALLNPLRKALSNALAHFSSPQVVLQIVTTVEKLRKYEMAAKRKQTIQYHREKLFLAHVAVSVEQNAALMARGLSDILQLKQNTSGFLKAHTELLETVGFYGCRIMYERCINMRLSVRRTEIIADAMIEAHNAFGNPKITNLMLKICCTPKNATENTPAEVDLGRFSKSFLLHSILPLFKHAQTLGAPVFHLFCRLCDLDGTFTHAEGHYNALRAIRVADARSCDVVLQNLNRNDEDLVTFYNLMNELLGYGEFALLAFFEVFLDASLGSVAQFVAGIRACKGTKVHFVFVCVCVCCEGVYVGQGVK